MFTRERSSAPFGKKKRHDNRNESDGGVSHAASVTTARYETLRGAALGGALPLEARHGLVVFLRCGMWGWARSLVPSQMTPAPPRCPDAASVIVPLEHRAMVHVLAAMAINRNDRRFR